MCVGDWRMGRLVRSVVRPWALATTSGLSLPADKNRVGLTLNLGGPAGLAGNSIQCSTGGLTIANLSVNIPFRHIDMLHFGDLPTRDFLLFGGAGTPTGTWIEYILPERYLAAALEYFESEYGKFLVGQR